MGFAAGNERLIGGADADQILPRLRRLHADPGRRRRRAERAAGLRRRDARALQGAPRRAGRRVCAPPAGRCPRPPARCSPGRRSRRSSRQLGSVEFSKLLLARGQGRGRARHRLRRAWRRPCPHRAGREQPPHPPGAAQHPQFLQGDNARPARDVEKELTRRHEQAAVASPSPASAPWAPACSRCWRRNADLLAARAAGRSSSAAVSARDRSRDRGVRSSARALVRRSGRARRRPRRRCGGRADRRQRRAARALVEAALAPASTWSPPTRRCWPSMAPNWPHWPSASGVPLAFEAAVAGGIPVIKGAARRAGRQPHPAASPAS